MYETLIYLIEWGVFLYPTNEEVISSLLVFYYPESIINKFKNYIIDIMNIYRKLDKDWDNISDEEKDKQLKKVYLNLKNAINNQTKQ